MRTIIEKQLEQLNRDFLQMGRLVNEAIYKSIKAFTWHDKALAQEVIDEDDRINALEKAIDQLCTEIIALQTPNTTDLRRIITTMKTSTDLERMGDHAVSISRSTIHVKGNKRSATIERLLSSGGEKIKTMGQEIIQAYVATDLKSALSVAERNHEIKELMHDARHFSVEQMRADPELVLGATDYILVTTYIERIGDYVTNIAEGLYYLETGEIKELN